MDMTFETWYVKESE